MDNRSYLEFIYAGNAVQRWHTITTHQRGTVGQHSAGVALIATWLSGVRGPSAALLLACLAHDLPEQIVGDIPSPTKLLIDNAALEATENKLLAEYGLLRLLTDAECRILKLADCFEGMMYCVQERRMGNKLIADSFSNYKAYVLEQTIEQGTLENKMLGAIITMWTVTNGC